MCFRHLECPAAEAVAIASQNFATGAIAAVLAIPTFALAVLSETIAVATETFATEAIVVIAAMLSQTDPQEISCVDRSAATAVTAAAAPKVQAAAVQLLAIQTVPAEAVPP